MDRRRGAIAGLAPAMALAALFMVSGSAAPGNEVAISLSLVALIAMSAGWLAGPLAVGDRRFLVPVFGYAIALIASTVALSVVQAAGDVAGGAGLDLVSIVGAGAGRLLYGFAAVTYLIIPAIVLGAIWSLAARGLTHLAESRSA